MWSRQLNFAFSGLTKRWFCMSEGVSATVLSWTWQNDYEPGSQAADATDQAGANAG